MDWFDFSLILLFGGAGIYASVKIMNATEQKVWTNIAIFLMVMGVGALGYSFVSKKVEAEDIKSSPSINQTITNSPGGINALGDVTVNPEVNPNAPTVTYDFNGMRRSVSMGGGLTINIEEKTPQVEAFKRMAELEKSKNWNELKKVCEEETTKTPEWLTPPLLCGRTYVEIGKVDEGIERIEFVQKKAAGRQDYTVADQLRNHIKEVFGK